MRALLCREYGPVDALDVAEIDDPVPDAGEVIVDVSAAGLNFPDVLMIAGQYQVKHPLPFVPGVELAGTISAVGDGVRDSLLGQRVMAATMGAGAFAEKIALDANMVIPLPPELDFEQGAGFIITYATTIHALRQSAALREGETLLVLGAAGGVGLAAVELGKAVGATVIAAASSDEKLAFTRQHGADETINYERDSLKDEVRRLTDGKGVDVVYDPVGGDIAQQALRGLAWQGRYLVIGFASGKIPEFPANLALLRESSIVGVYWGEWSSRNPAAHVQNMEDLAALAAEGKISAHVSSVHALDDFRDAFAAITGRKARGKVILSLRR